MKKHNAKAKMAAMSIIAAGMMMAAPLAAFADTVTAPTAEDAVTVTINNVNDAQTVTAYRIVEPTYDTNGFVAFNKVAGVTMADITNPTGAEVTAIAQAILGGTLTPAESVTMTKGADGTTYTGDLKAGEYIVLVTDVDSAGTVYNPMIVSAYYTDANDSSKLVAASALDASGNFTGDVYAKKTTIKLDKTIVSADGNNGTDDDKTAFPNSGAQGDDLGVGDTGKFQISTQIPAYSAAYSAKGVTYTLVDTQDAGFDAPSNIVVTVGSETITATSTLTEANATFTQTITDNDFTLDFASAFILNHAGQNVTVTYDAKLNENAVQKLDANNDKVVLTYTNDVYDKSHVDTLEDDVQEYSFPIQIKKTGDENAVLKGAEFTLTRTDADAKTGTKTFTVATGEDGIAQFDHLDEGVYTVKETKAPAGYTINPDTFKITITPTYGTDGKLASYAVNMVNTSDNDSVVGNIVVDAADDDIIAGEVVDTKLQTLPSTGGQGTQIAIVLATGMAGVTALVFALGKKKDKAE